MPSILSPPLSTSAGPVHACWSKAGVWGEGDCPELERFVHCRNCPVYSAAAVSMLDRALPDGYAEAWAVHFAAPKPPPERDTTSLLIFRVNAEWLALPVSALVEIVERRPVHSLPHARRSFLKGIVNVRGQLLVCVSLTSLLQLTERTVAQKTSSTIFERLLVVRSDRGPLVFPVSEVAGVSRHGAAELRAPPATVARAGVHFTRAVLAWRNLRRPGQGTAPEDVVVALLDEDRLFQSINGGLS